MIITKTPYRISFFGGGSDYPSWYKKNGGAVLSTTIDKYIFISTGGFKNPASIPSYLFIFNNKFFLYNINDRTRNPYRTFRTKRSKN